MKDKIKDRGIKISIIVALCALITWLIFSILYKIYCVGDLTDSEISFLITTSKNFFQILFFILIGVVTILSYLQARKTLFTPIKTETFKMQIKTFEDILAFFQTKTETDLTDLFDYKFMVSANGSIMFSEFIEHFYSDEVKVDRDKITELNREFVGFIATQSWAEKNFTSLEYIEKTEYNEPEKPTNPAIILDSWKKYEFGPISYSRKFHESREKLQQLIASPLIPSELKTKLEDFDKIVHHNLSAIGITLNEIAQELPEKFPTSKSLSNLDPHGIWNLYIDNKKAMDKPAKEILIYIKDYLKIDSLTK
ncbi:hypothetical protein [Arenibacter nanhaiticus]|uniref:hypothetical protein n=1 Tax=Arenibacter nanhaiticus TaxID=558155 RepID=UPI001160DED6|nr:hypothetical protein [Arenibacter nanhaiticus]